MILNFQQKLSITNLKLYKLLPFVVFLSCKNVVDGISSEDLSFEIFPKGMGQADNNVCVVGICNSVSSDVSDYGGRYSNEQQLSDIG